MKNTIKFWLILIITATLFLTSCCGEPDDSDFQFAESYNALLKPYVRNDTIFFEDKEGELDTILISNIDTLQQSGCFMVTNRRIISIEIKHLPINKWTGATELNQDGSQKVLDQDLILIEKMLNDKNKHYFISIYYRHFMDEIMSIDSFSTDEKFIELGVSKYWTIKNQSSDWPQYKKDSTIILKAYWTEKYGLTGYDLRNGDSYRIKDGAIMDSIQ